MQSERRRQCQFLSNCDRRLSGGKGLRIRAQKENMVMMAGKLQYEVKWFLLPMSGEFAESKLNIKHSQNNIENQF